MSVLKLMSRPVVTFNAKDKKHRALFAEFVRSNKWNHSPVRFVASEATEIDVGTMQRQVIEFYTEKEFAKAV